MAECKECLHYDVCEVLENGNGIKKVHPIQCGCFKPSANVVGVRHGKWHIMPEDPYDDSESPTEEGWYRIITTDGEEMTDYYFNKPTLIGRGVVYWKNCKRGIRAWAKMDGKDGAE